MNCIMFDFRNNEFQREKKFVLKHQITRKVDIMM